ncbi:MAG TPA: CRTAC1 family protein [Terriglobia bacterium]|nr:CRTAC1 family protein [Terriglobia bacterium]
MTRRAILRAATGGLAGLFAACSRSHPKPQSQIFDSAARQLSGQDPPPVTFTDVTRQAGIDFVHSAGARTHQLPEDMGPGAAWGDYDNDGWPDLYLVNQPGPWGIRPGPDAPYSHLYRNNRDGTFTDVTLRAGVANRGGYGMGAAWGDYDNDGHLDLYVTNYGRSVLYHNNGDGTFTDATERAGVANRLWGMTPVWVDYDRDGYLDLYVANYADYNLRGVPVGATSQEYGTDVPFTLNPASFQGVPNRLYHNNRDGTFTDVAARLGVDDPDGRSLAAAFADFNLDGWPDFYIANDISSNRMFLGLGRGRFRNVSAASWTEENRGTMGIAVGDYDGDGDFDIFLTHWIGQGDALYQNLWFEQKAAGQLHFSDVADMYGCGEIAMGDAGWGTFFFDFDNDGQLDLLAINGSTLEDKSDSSRLVPQRPFLFWSKGPDGFYDVARSGAVGSALKQAIVGRGAACADFDRDGDLDLIIMTNHGRPMLLRNDGGNRGHWLAVHLAGTRSNRSAFGARVCLTAAGKQQVREYGVSGSYLSQSAPEVWFGLGPANRVELLEIFWPSGTRQTFEAPPVDRMLSITEGKSSVVPD